jgi:hypothetical protein
MAEMRICETVATQTSTALGTYDAVYGPWNNTHCIPGCVCEVQGEEKVTVQLSVLESVLVCECQ